MSTVKHITKPKAHHIREEHGKFTVYDAQQRFRARFNSHSEAIAYVQVREAQHRARRQPTLA